jgi:hypothetical protein
VARLTKQARVGALAAMLVSSAAGAQIMRRPAGRPVINWAGASIGLVQGFGINDGTTNSAWSFGSGLAYAGRLEHPFQGGALAFGLQGSYARLPLGYSSPSYTGDAEAMVTEFMGVLRYGGGYSFHPVYELQVGAIGFSDFRSTGTTPEVKLSTSTDYDPKLAIAYGFGFGLSSKAAIEIVQEIGTILHQRDGLAASQSNYPRITVTRLGGKIAF